MPTTAEAMKFALGLHRAGDLPRAEAVYRQILQVEPSNPAALHYLGMVEQARGNLALAIELMQRSLAIKPDQPSAWINLAGCLHAMRRIEESVDACRSALRYKPEYPSAMQNFARVLQRAGQVLESSEMSRAQLKLQPENPDALWNIELCSRELAAATRQPPADELPTRSLSLIVTCYGDYPQYSLRCVESFVTTPGALDRCDVHVACNTCSSRTLVPLRQHFDAGRITTLIESNRNINKDPMIRVNLGLTRTPYVLLLDDDSHVTSGWLDAIDEFIRRNHPFDVAGEIFTFDRIPRYQAMVESKPWWKGRNVGHPAYRDKVFFATGGMVLARVEFLRRHNFPDRSMVIWRDDVMLSDLTNQTAGTLLRFPKSVMDHAFINDGIHRGEDDDKLVPAEAGDFDVEF